MFGFIKKVFFTRLTILASVNWLNATQLTATTFNSGSCININNPYAKMCVPDVAKKLRY